MLMVGQVVKGKIKASKNGYGGQHLFIIDLENGRKVVANLEDNGMMFFEDILETINQEMEAVVSKVDSDNGDTLVTVTLHNEMFLGDMTSGMINDSVSVEEGTKETKGKKEISLDELMNGEVEDKGNQVNEDISFEVDGMKGQKSDNSNLHVLLNEMHNAFKEQDEKKFLLLSKEIELIIESRGNDTDSFTLKAMKNANDIDKMTSNQHNMFNNVAKSIDDLTNLSDSFAEEIKKFKK